MFRLDHKAETEKHITDFYLNALCLPAKRVAAMIKWSEKDERERARE